jgi:GR25 family glycosyltransferase involved in LPS biosynthesis
MNPVAWNDLLHAPCFVINMDRCINRWNIAKSRIHIAGFVNVERIRGLDKDTDDLDTVWQTEHGAPHLLHLDNFDQNRGKQACALGHYQIWQRMIRQNIPYAVVFEDDVLFHRNWHEYAPQFWENTPRDFHVLYMGSSFDIRAPNLIMQAPCYCTHAMVITLEGAKKMYDICLKHPDGTWTIDIMLRKYMENTYNLPESQRLSWYVWNGWPVMDPVAIRSPKWQDRLKNSGLVFQDETMGSFVNEDITVNRYIA